MGWGRMRGWNGEAVLAAATVWIVLGLMAQVRDLWRTFHGRSGLARDQRWGWRFAVFWRLGVACLLSGYYGVNLLLHQGLIELPENQLFPGLDEQPRTGHDLREVLFYLSLVIVLFSTPRLAPKRKQRRFSHVLDVVAVIGGALVCLLIVLERMIFPFLIHAALKQIDLAHSLRFSSVDVYSEARDRLFLVVSLLAAAAVLTSMAVIRQFVRQWQRSLRRRVIWTGLLIFSLALAGVYPIWMATGGLRSVSPAFVDAQETGPINRWVYTLLVLSVFATAATCRLVLPKEQPAGPAESNWRRSKPAYHHERRALMLVVVIGILVEYKAFSVRPDVLIWWFVMARRAGFCAIAVLLLAGYGVLARERPAGAPELPVPLFLVTWPAVFLVTVFGICTVHWLGFAFWLGPWYLLSWP